MPDINIPAMQWALRVVGFALGIWVGWEWRKAKEPRLFGRGYGEGWMDAKEAYRPKGEREA